MSSVEKTEINHFVSYLQRLHREKSNVALAHMRRGIDKALGDMPERDACLFGCPAVASADKAFAEAIPLIAGLFALHPSVGKGVRLGSALQSLKSAAPSNGIERRFIGMLEADRSDLANHLRGVVLGLKAAGIAIDWKQLTHDVMTWDDPTLETRQEWARQFWASAQPSERRTPAVAEPATELVEQNA